MTESKDYLDKLNGARTRKAILHGKSLTFWDTFLSGERRFRPASALFKTEKKLPKILNFLLDITNVPLNIVDSCLHPSSSSHPHQIHKVYFSLPYIP